YLFSASHRRVVGTDAAVSQSRQRLECGDSSPLSSASTSQLAADPSVPRAKAPTSWRTPNAAATAKPALPPRTHRVRNALNTYPRSAAVWQVQRLRIFTDHLDRETCCGRGPRRGPPALRCNCQDAPA